MKNLSEILAIDHRCRACLSIEVIKDAGLPDFRIILNDKIVFAGSVAKSQDYDFDFDLREKFNVTFELKNKKYRSDKETAIVIKKFCVDDIEILPRYNHLLTYENDHNQNITTNYMGYNGKLYISSNENFYMWYHSASDQGLLLKP